MTSTGVLGHSETGYFSLDIYQAVESISPSTGCREKQPLPDFSHLKPAKGVRHYLVVMNVDYGQPGDHPIRFQISEHGRNLYPWQAYASYDLTGGFSLYGHCAKGFAVDQVFGTPEARPGHFDEPGDPSDMATYDPESATASGPRLLKLGYTCTRTK